MQWYFKVNEEVRGPISEFELHKMAKRGKLRPEDLVMRKSDEEKWVPASSVPGLIEEASDKGPGLSMASRPGATIRRKVTTIRQMFKGSKSNVLSDKMGDLGLNRKSMPSAQKKKFRPNPSAFLGWMVIFFALSYLLYLHQAGGLSKLYMQASSKFGVDMSEQAVRARSMSFARLLVNLRNKKEADAKELLMGYMAPHHSTPGYVNRLYDQYGRMTRENCAVRASVLNANVSPSNKRATVTVSITMQKNGKNHDNAMRMTWQVVGNEWRCLPN